MQKVNKLSKVLSEDDFAYLEKIIGNRKGDVSRLYSLKGKVMHGTNDCIFQSMVKDKKILTKGKSEGMYNSTGASFTDGDSEVGLTFQTIFDDQNTRSDDKKFNSDKYSDKVRDFINFFWKDGDRRKKFQEYLSKISNGKTVDTFDQARSAAERFKFKAIPKELKNDAENLQKLVGVTIIFGKPKLPDLAPTDKNDPTGNFELRSFRKNGIPLEDASAVFVPESQIDAIKRILKTCRLSHIEIRPSEELEILRMIQLIDSK